MVEEARKKLLMIYDLKISKEHPFIQQKCITSFKKIFSNIIEIHKKKNI